MSLFDDDVDGEFRVNHEYKKGFESGMREQELKKSKTYIFLRLSLSSLHILTNCNRICTR